MSTTDVSNHLINFPMCTECMQRRRAEVYKETKDTYTVCTFEDQNNRLLILIIISRSHLLNFLLGTGNEVLINVGLITTMESSLLSCDLPIL